MNTSEIKTTKMITTFNALWRYSEKQFLRYEKLEGISNWREYDFSIDCSQDQMKLKDMLQIRCIEELTEATHALDNREHFFEEITDSLNFFLSAYVMIGVNLSEMPDPEELLSNSVKLKINYENCSKAFYKIVDDIGDLCNLLKNRPWAQSNYLVSMADFDKRLITLWTDFWSMLGSLGMSKEQVFDLFERKYRVNDWRIRTGY